MRTCAAVGSILAVGTVYGHGRAVEVGESADDARVVVAIVGVGLSSALAPLLLLTFVLLLSLLVLVLPLLILVLLVLLNVVLFARLSLLLLVFGDIVIVVGGVGATVGDATVSGGVPDGDSCGIVEDSIGGVGIVVAGVTVVVW